MSQVLNGYDGDFSERCRLDQSCYSPPSLKDRMTLDDKRILILGGTSGIGLAVANAAANEGASVVVVSSRQAKVQAALQNLPKSAQGHVATPQTKGRSSCCLAAYNPSITSCSLRGILFGNAQSEKPTSATHKNFSG